MPVSLQLVLVNKVCWGIVTSIRFSIIQDYLHTNMTTLSSCDEAHMGFTASHSHKFILYIQVFAERIWYFPGQAWELYHCSHLQSSGQGKLGSVGEQMGWTTLTVSAIFTSGASWGCSKIVCGKWVFDSLHLTTAHSDIRVSKVSRTH